MPSESGSSTTRQPRRLVPGGVVATRRAVRRRGGFVGVGVAGAMLLAGWLVRVIVGGATGGIVGFVLTVTALPTLPILGVPAADGNALFAISLVASTGLWWILGQLAALRVSGRALVGWREWSKEFALLSVGICAGAIGALALGAVLLGAL
ncbi:MAG: hypothetical protein EXQ63_05630 [Ilumatobacteraceae bacterium]|nr:hypothetical protein [Ilumatobacteraceae bacterium]